jgi:hypothetical protein
MDLPEFRGLQHRCQEQISSPMLRESRTSVCVVTNHRLRPASRKTGHQAPVATCPTLLRPTPLVAPYAESPLRLATSRTAGQVAGLGVSFYLPRPIASHIPARLITVIPSRAAIRVTARQTCCWASQRHLRIPRFGAHYQPTVTVIVTPHEKDS